MMRIGLFAAVAAIAAPAWGQTALGPVLERLEAQGYGGFEVERERGQLKVEAVRNGVQRELVYDLSSGRLIEDSTRPTDDRGGAVATGRFTSLYNSLSAAGYSDIEIEQRGGRIEVDAVRNGVERDLTYDARSGALISSRVDDDDRRGRGRADDNPGRKGRGGDDRGRDDRGGDDDDDDDDRNDDHGGRGGGHDDDGDDDRGGRGGGSGGRDDNGGRGGRGADHDRGDDHGGRGGSGSGSGGDRDDDDDDDGDDD